MLRILSSMTLALTLAIVGCGGTTPPTDVVDMAGATDAALKPFGQPCAANEECESNICFIGGNRTFCSIHCTMATAATDCPVPPTSGTCNMQGYCKP
jgi:hypothetical protein